MPGLLAPPVGAVSPEPARDRAQEGLALGCPLQADGRGRILSVHAQGHASMLGTGTPGEEGLPGVAQGPQTPCLDCTQRVGTQKALR